jgi:uncharacterized protein
VRLDSSGSLLLSPSDLSGHLACEHLTALELQVVRGELERPRRENAQAELIRRKGEEHEAAFLAELRSQGREVVDVGLGDDGFAAAAARTEELLRAGVEVVYQGVLASSRWRGIADFLVRVDEPSELGSFSYEAWDTKLARYAKPSAVLQLTFYSSELERIQGVLPRAMRVVLGTGEWETFRPADFTSYYRNARGGLAMAVDSPTRTCPYPVDHCGICDFLPLCNERWDRDDHLVRVAQIRRQQIERLGLVGIRTLEALGDAAPGATVAQMAPATFETLRAQAALQLFYRRTGLHRYELLEPVVQRGLGLLPAPSAGDLFYDIEGDPFWEPGKGLEYLHGLMHCDGTFTAIWAHTREEERRAVERLLDLFHERLAVDPGMHVYHYASYETSTLKRLVAEHATGEEALDELLRREVFIDLYRVVRQSLRISHPRYSIKNVRQFFMTAEADLSGGDDAIVLYEQWIAERDPVLLEAVERYNEEDCVSTVRLRDWLVERKAEAERRYGLVIPWRESPEQRARSEERVEALDERERLRDRLLAVGDSDLALLGHLLDYHHREAKPVWWWFFTRCELTAEELVDDAESIGCVQRDGSLAEPVGGRSKSEIHGYRFPVQQHKLDPGDGVYDPVTEKTAGSIETLDSVAGTLRLRRSPAQLQRGDPEALIPGGPYDTREQQAALERFARSALARDDRYPHLEQLFRREPPLHGRRVQRETLQEMRDLVEQIEGSYLFVQGPPGAGKTWTGARLVTRLLSRGKRVGIASMSHRAIHKLLAEIEVAAAEDGVLFRGLKKASTGNRESFYEGPMIESTTSADVFADADHDLFAGTSWLFARADLDGLLDYLFVDEAGQVSLADALALGTCARTLVLLGDPVQLPHVRQGVHPENAGRSVLEHLLDEAQDTVAPEMGLFLERSFRMHPEVCRYISSAFYEERLESAPGCERQATSLGTGIRYLEVFHEGNSTQSEEEAAAIRAEIEELLGETWTDKDGSERPISPSDIMVVAPFNAQVRLLTERLPNGVAVGTVDKFQGQQAVVVFFSMASSSGDDAPRGIDFLMSRNRLNVAVSRAQCLAYLACSPNLLQIECKAIEHMRLANALCRFVEIAESMA